MRTAGTRVAAGLAMPIFMNRRHLVLLLLCNFAGNVVGVCPHCNGHFASCTYDNVDGTCPTIRVVAENAAAFVAGHGSISLSDIIPCRYLKMFTVVRPVTSWIKAHAQTRDPRNAVRVHAPYNLNELGVAVGGYASRALNRSDR